MIFLGEGRVRSSISTATRSFSVTNSDKGLLPMGFCRTVRVLLPDIVHPWGIPKIRERIKFSRPGGPSGVSSGSGSWRKRFFIHLLCPQTARFRQDLISSPFRRKACFTKARSGSRIWLNFGRGLTSKSPKPEGSSDFNISFFSSSGTARGSVFSPRTPFNSLLPSMALIKARIS